jgi:hypothetical protein
MVLAYWYAPRSKRFFLRGVIFIKTRFLGSGLEAGLGEGAATGVLGDDLFKLFAY